METASVPDRIRRVIHFFNITWKGGRPCGAESPRGTSKDEESHPANLHPPIAAGLGITVHSATEEYRHILQERCACGGVFLPGLQVARSSASGQFNVINAACAGCGSVHQFEFFVQSINPCPKLPLV